MTGASEGIGWGFAQLFAKNDFNIILISRTKEKLAQRAEFLETKFGVKTKIIAADLSSNDEHFFK